VSSYTLGVTVAGTFDDAVEATRTALAGQGFGVLTEIDVRDTLERKLGVRVPAQLILGACNPGLAHEALTCEPSIGALLPCNVVVRHLDDGHVRVEALDPAVMVQATGNPDLEPVAAQAAARLRAALAGLGRPDPLGPDAPSDGEDRS
jgi:uncharacterized protein (DUF302 family)